MSKRVLDVGQCGVDGPRISRILTHYLHCTVDHADTKKDALEMVGEEDYDLVLVNRMLDRTKTPGVEVIEAIKKDHPDLRVMLVSDNAEVQKEAVKLGAIPGFGKSRLESGETEKLLRMALGTHEEEAA